jgi:hypothetical protein
MSIQNNDMHSNISVQVGVEPVAVGTTGTGKVGRILDRRGYGGVEFIVAYGAVTSSTAVFTVTVLEGDVTGTMTSVADGDLIGTEALAGLAAGARTDYSTEKVMKKVGYKGRKRYVQCGVKSTATAGTTVDACRTWPEARVDPLSPGPLPGVPTLLMDGGQDLRTPVESAAAVAVVREDPRFSARLRFAGGCVANVTASRVSLKTERKLRVFRDDSYVSIDLQQRILTVIGKRDVPLSVGELPVTISESNFEQGDALRAEIRSFLECIHHGKAPLVSGEDGMRALDIAIRITALLSAQQA